MNIGGLNSNSESQYAQLHDIVHGKINMGEVVVDKSGKFDKINNHEFVNWNFHKVSSAQNKATREAVFKLVSEHVKAKYGADANLLVPKIRSYLQLDTKNVEQKVERTDVKVLMDVMDDQAYVDKCRNNSQARTDLYNEVASMVSGSGIPSERKNEILNACYVRLLCDGREIKKLTAEVRKSVLDFADAAVKAGPEKSDAIFSMALSGLKDGAKIPSDVGDQNRERRMSEFATIVSKYGTHSNMPRNWKLSGEEMAFLTNSLLGDNSTKPLPFESRRQLADILDKVQSGPKRMTRLQEWAQSTQNIVTPPTASEPQIVQQSQQVKEQPQPEPEVKPQTENAKEDEYVQIPTGEIGEDVKIPEKKVEQKDSNKAEPKDSNKVEQKDSNRVETESKPIDLDALCDEIEKNKTSRKEDAPEVSESLKTEQTVGTEQTVRAADLFAGHDALGEAHKKLDERYGDNTSLKKMEIYTDEMKKALNNEAFLNAASQQVKDLKTGDDFKKEYPELWAAAINDSEKSHRLSKNPFKHAKGYSTNVAMNILMDAIKKGNLDKVKISLSIFADCTYCGCGIFAGYNTQEEATVRDFGLLLLAYFMKEGLVKQAGTPKVPKFEYVEKNRKQLSPAGDGFMVSAPLLYNSLQKINWPEKDKNGNPINLETLAKHLCLQFRSAASFDAVNSCNEDVFGDVQYKRDFMQFFGGKAGKKEMNGDEVATTQSFLRALYPEMRKAFSGVEGKTLKETDAKKKELGRQMLMLFMFTDEFDALAPEKGSFFGKTRSSEIKRLTGMVMKGKHTKLLQTARENYINTMRLKIRMDILMAKANGIKQVIGGAIGCGAFFNEPELMGRMYAEEFDKYADDDMEFICPDAGKSNGEVFVSFSKGFNDHFAGRPKVADAEKK